MFNEQTVTTMQQGVLVDRLARVVAEYCDTHKCSMTNFYRGDVNADGEVEIADAVFTLTLLSRGAIEVNPFMAWLIETDIQLFAIIKMALTGVCLIFLVMHINFRIYRLLKVNHVLYACLPLYALLIAYEMVLLTKFATSSISF